jgi:hypothetical protein
LWEEQSHEEEQVHRRTDFVRVEAGRDGDAGGRGPSDGDLGADILPKKLYGGLVTGELRRLKQLEEENRRPKQLVADLSLDKHILQDVLSKKL